MECLAVLMFVMVMKHQFDVDENGDVEKTAMMNLKCSEECHLDLCVYVPLRLEECCHAHCHRLEAEQVCRR